MNRNIKNIKEREQKWNKQHYISEWDYNLFKSDEDQIICSYKQYSGELLNVNRSMKYRQLQIDSKDKYKLNRVVDDVKGYCELQMKIEKMIDKYMLNGGGMNIIIQGMKGRGIERWMVSNQVYQQSLLMNVLDHLWNRLNDDQLICLSKLQSKLINGNRIVVSCNNHLTVDGYQKSVMIVNGYESIRVKRDMQIDDDYIDDGQYDCLYKLTINNHKVINIAFIWNCEQNVNDGDKLVKGMLG